jgi:hypothetical protein
MICHVHGHLKEEYPLFGRKWELMKVSNTTSKEVKDLERDKAPNDERSWDVSYTIEERKLHLKKGQ